MKRVKFRAKRANRRRPCTDAEELVVTRVTNLTIQRHEISGGHISRICQISALSGNILPFMSSLHFWHFCRKIHRFTLIGIFDNDSLLRALSKTENKYFKTICFRYGTSQHIIKHRKIVVNNTNQSKSMDFSSKMPKKKTTHAWKNVSWKRWNLTNSRNVTRTVYETTNCWDVCSCYWVNDFRKIRDIFTQPLRLLR